MTARRMIDYAYAGSLESDTPEQRLQKAILVVIPTAISISCLFWSSAYFFFNKPVPAAIPGGYAVISAISIAIFFRTKDYNFFRFSQLFLILWLPFLLQASLGGFRSGSAVQVWAMLAPIGALMFHGVRPATYWMLAYIVMTIISGLLESTLSAFIAPLPASVIEVFFVLNIGVAFTIIFFSVQYNVTENSRILQVVKEQTQKLMQMDKIKNRFFANISHEFRTPLALTLGPIEDALNNEYGEINQSLRSQLEVMLRNSRRLLRLINQLLDISKIESGEMQLKLESNNIVQFLSRIRQNFVPYAERKNISLEFSADQDVLDVEFDKEKLDKIVNNLLSNAFKFTPEKGRIKLSVGKIKSGHRYWVELKVKDNGEGVLEDDVDKIFDRFFQVDGSSTREHEGTGIGLSLVKELVDLHHGSISVKSDPGFGCEFRVLLPWKKRQGSSVKMVTDESSGCDIASADMELASLNSAPGFALNTAQINNENRASVLVVDDNEDIRQYVHSCLSAFYNVYAACDGLDGLEQVKHHHPDLVISDIMMPRMNGYDFCRKLKEPIETRHIPLIFLTAKASDEMLVEGLAIGADDYLSKPFNSKELLARVNNLITLKQQEKDLLQLNSELEKKLKDQIEELIKTKRLSNYFSQNLLNRILSSEDTEEMVTERRNITILFCDLCNFTDMTDRLEVEKATILLNEYLSEMTILIEQHDGTIVQIIGDAIMVFFGAPTEMSDKDQAIKAVQLGIEIQKKVAGFSGIWKNKGIDYDIRARIGIHQDYVAVGNFGSNSLMEYTAVGRGVNLASRLENACRPGHIKVSQTIYMLSKDQYPFGPLQEEQFKGFTRQIKVSELSPEMIA